MTSQSPNINRWRAFALLAVAFFMTVSGSRSPPSPAETRTQRFDGLAAA